jgi:hypothetical protein
MADVLTADVLNHSAPIPAAPTQARATAPAATREVAHEAPQAPLTYETSASGQQFLDRVDAAKRSALEGVAEYRVKDMTNTWDAAHAMGKERGVFEQANRGRDLDGDWKQDRSIHGANDAFAQHSEEAAMNERANKAYAAAKEAGHGPEWKEAFDLGKAHIHNRAEFEGVSELAETGVKMLAKDAAGFLTEGPVGEAMALRDAATIAARAPSIGTVLAGSAAGSAVMAVTGAIATEALEHAEKSLGLPAEKINPVVHSINEGLAPAAHALSSFQGGVQDFIHYGDSKIDQVSHAISSAAAPVTEPVERATHAVAKAAEPYTAPVTHALSDMMAPVGEALHHVKESVEHLRAKALQEELAFTLEHRGSASLTADEAHQVIKELAHANKGDTLVIENHAIHMVPAGTRMPDFPASALKLDADVLREGLGIERAPVQAQAHAQPAAQPTQVAQAAASHGMER